MLVAQSSVAQQETVFMLLKSDRKLADEYYRNTNYEKALSLYTKLYHGQEKGELRLQIARCFFFLKDYKKAVTYFENHVRSNAALSADDLWMYAEANASAGRREKAIEGYRIIVRRNPEDTLARQKLWQMTNIEPLYEDSLHYFIRPVSFNSTSSEFITAAENGELFFLSNREVIRSIQKTDHRQERLYDLYSTRIVTDSSGNNTRYGKPIVRNLIKTALQPGRLCFYNSGNSIAFISSSTSSNAADLRTLRLQFATRVQRDWKITEDFAYNSNAYSINDPWISNDGTMLLFSSDMPGGVGGKDLYICKKIAGNWSSPENLVKINTRFDEITPFINEDGDLYFASNGHAGLGGFDIFKYKSQTSEIENVGYPLNSVADDFGILMQSKGTHAYFSSNRRTGGFDDDIFEADIDLQKYPLSIAGTIHIKEFVSADSSVLKPCVNAEFNLIDDLRNISVFRTQSDIDGNFKVSVPYFSRYKIQIIGDDKQEHVVSFDLPRHQKIDERHDIVLVRDLYKSTDETLKIVEP